MMLGPGLQVPGGLRQQVGIAGPDLVVPGIDVGDEILEVQLADVPPQRQEHPVAPGPAPGNIDRRLEVVERPALRDIGALLVELGELRGQPEAHPLVRPSERIVAEQFHPVFLDRLVGVWDLHLKQRLRFALEEHGRLAQRVDGKFDAQVEFAARIAPGIPGAPHHRLLGLFIARFVLLFDQPVIRFEGGPARFAIVLGLVPEEQEFEAPVRGKPMLE